MEQNTNGGMDILSTPIETLWKEDIEWIESQLRMLIEEDRLCKGTGAEVIAEFEFKGGFDEVVNQLTEFLEKVKLTPYKEIDRFDVLNRTERYTEHRNQNPDLYRAEMVKSIKKRSRQGITEALNIADARYKLNETLHDKKECLCYVN